MGRAKAVVDVGVLASAAEELWYDTRRWPTFVDGLAHVDKVEGDWPRAGRIVWDSKPGGRGRVVERVLEHEARTGQTVAVEDGKITGTQRIAFEPTDHGCRISLTLDYDVKQRRPLMPVFDLLFLRRPMNDSLKRTLVRFSRELDAADGL